ncbi:MAG: dehydrogenase [Planctomycetota bacterium]|nr:MAG: dehydrogenase [Planctomycetota bacterium]
MRQILQSLATGQTELVDVPCPAIGTGQVLIQSRISLVSAGTERMLVEFGKASLLEKARQQPDKVWQVLDKVKTDGLVPTLTAVRSKLDQPIPLGYCNVGVVLEVGQGVDQFQPGDRVASNGPHAEVVSVPKNLCAKIPDGVTDEAAAFTVLGSIGLQGIRLAQPTLGEAFVVSGLGLIGLITVQLLKAHGCRVLGLDFSPARLELAKKLGAETFNLSSGNPLDAATQFSRGRGVDGVIITAATESDEPMHQAAQMCRRRGRIVLVGVVGLKLMRADFYEKELSFQVSCSYGPGRYDSDYEQRGHDYPIGFVRWTEQRNFEAMLDMMASGQIDPAALVSHRFAVDQAVEAYDLISSKQPSLGILLEYPSTTAQNDLRQQTIRFHTSSAPLSPATATQTLHSKSGQPFTIPAHSAVKPQVAIIGAGNYASQVLIPAFKKNQARLACVASRNGLTAAYAARKFGFDEATSDLDQVMNDDRINAVVIATRHDSHARLACQGLAAGKHVFVEKPLALSAADLAKVLSTYRQVCSTQGQSAPILTVGFNRRFAPQILQMKSLLSELQEPKSFIMTVNAGAIPHEHWVHDPIAGGGRLIGEGCHFIDLLRFLCNSPIVSVQATMFGQDSAVEIRDDKITMTLAFADGSFGTIHYLANGHRSIAKERLEVFCAGRVIQLDNFRRMTAVGWKKFRRMNLWQQDKGHVAEIRAFLLSIEQGGPPPISLEELAEVTQVSFDVIKAAETQTVIRCLPPAWQLKSHSTDEPLARSA